MKPLVSIVMPIYNVAQYVERALVSALNQTYPNIEIICVDDCGKDNSMEIVERIKEQHDKDSKIRILHHDYNRGLSAARNTGLDNMRGDYVYFMDSDDEITPDCIERLETLVEKYPQVEIVVGNIAMVSGSKNIGKYSKECENFDIYPEYSDNREWITKNIFDYSDGTFIPSVAQNKLYQYKFFIENNLRFLEGIIHEDEKFVFDYAKYVSKMAFCKNVTYIRYINEGSIMSTLTIERSVKAWNVIIKSSLPEISEPYKKLKVGYCASIFMERFLHLRRSSLKEQFKAKSTFVKIAWYSLLFKNYYCAWQCWRVALTPFCLYRLTKVKVRYEKRMSLSNMLKGGL